MNKPQATGYEAQRLRRLEYRENWPQHCARYGFGASELGRRFHYNGDLWEIVGIDPAKNRFGIVLGIVQTGELRRFSKTIVRACCPAIDSIS